MSILYPKELIHIRPDLSIIIPTFNRASYLKQSLEVIREDAVGLYDNLEVVISDNASEDNTEQIVHSFVEPHIRYFRNTDNFGVYENVLLACERCTGRYILLLSDDDLFSKGALGCVLEQLQHMPQIGVIASPIEVFEDGFPDLPIGRPRFPGTASNIFLKKGPQAVSGLFLRTSSLSGLVIRRDLLDIAGARKHARSLYPQMYLVGYAAKKADALYLAQPLVKIRVNPVTHWSYSSDFMAGAVLDILKDLTRDEPWGREVRKKVTRKRILAAYGPLYSARDYSWKAYVQTTRGFASVPEYRRSGLFWFLALGIGLLGARGIDRIRQTWRGPVIDRIN